MTKDLELDTEKEPSRAARTSARRRRARKKVVCGQQGRSTRSRPQGRGERIAASNSTRALWFSRPTEPLRVSSGILTYGPISVARTSGRDDASLTAIRSTGVPTLRPQRCVAVSRTSCAA